jgi:hypothetical protein
MGKHKSDKLSQTSNVEHNKAGNAPQVPKVGSTQKNTYR